MVSRPPKGQLIRNSAPSSGMTCSLELSLPSPAGIWFKTPLSVGDTNTAPLALIPKDEMVSWRPEEIAETPRLQWPGVWGSPAVRGLWNTH